MKTKLSVNINKIATLRNSRGGNLPDLVKVAIDCEKFGAQGITVHPRPDERHIKYKDVLKLKPILTTEFNIEGRPNPAFNKLVETTLPAQVTLVPDGDDALTSNAGWNTKKELKYLKSICKHFSDLGIRVSIFVDPDVEMVKYAAETGCHRVELYTEAYASNYSKNPALAIEPYYKAALTANEYNLGLNAGHDLNLENLKYFSNNIPGLLEVSIGHALISDALYFGLEETIKKYLNQISKI